MANTRPFGAFGFQVEVEGVGALGCFQEVSGLSVTIETDPKPEGGVNGTKRQLIKGMSYGPVTLKRGLCDRGMFDWINNFMKGRIKRYRVTISLLDDNQEKVVTKYVLKNVIPSKWNGPSLSVTSDAIATESLELVHEGLEIVEPK